MGHAATLGTTSAGSGGPLEEPRPELPATVDGPLIDPAGMLTQEKGRRFCVTLSQHRLSLHVEERHRTPWANVQMDDPTVVVVTHTRSATPKRLSHRATSWRNVSRTTVEVLRVWSSTDTSVVGRGPIPADDTERLARDRPDALKYLDEVRIGADDLLRAMLIELPPGEVR